MTTLIPRWRFVDCPEDLLSIYDNFPVARMENGINARVPEHALAAVLRLRDAIEARGGRFRLIGWGRSYETSKRVHDEYLSGGTFAKKPGLSWHNGWLAIDADVEGSGLTKAEYDLCAIEAGLSSISNEGWHYEIRDGLEHILDRYDDDTAAMCASLLAGLAWFGKDEYRALQAGLHFAGVDPGVVDGVPGDNTNRALDALELRRDASYLALHRFMPAAY